MFGSLFGGYMPTGRFQASYRCYPVSFIDRTESEKGDKVFLPPSALDRLSQLHIDYPMLFRVENPQTQQSTHCGVLEFVADEGMIYMPYWMMQNLALEEGAIIRLTSATLPKGSFVKLQPHSKDFLDISNPRAVLETTLRNFTCLTVGDTIPISYNNKRYYIDIIEAQPGDAISVVETDCNVDFAPPLDYVEPEPMASGSGTRGGDTLVSAAGSQAGTETVDGGATGPATGTPAEPEQPTFLAFAGKGNRLDGRPASASAPVPVPLANQPALSQGASEQQSAQGTASGGNGSAPKKAGKLMFRDRLAAKFAPEAQGKASSAPAAADLAPAPAADKNVADDAGGNQAFQAFQGKGRSLRD